MHLDCTCDRETDRHHSENHSFVLGDLKIGYISKKLNIKLLTHCIIFHINYYEYVGKQKSHFIKTDGNDFVTILIIAPRARVKHIE